MEDLMFWWTFEYDTDKRAIQANRSLHPLLIQLKTSTKNGVKPPLKIALLPPHFSFLSFRFLLLSCTTDR